MIKQTIDYLDYNGKGQRDELYFNLTEFEVIEIQVASPLGIHGDLRRAIDEEDNQGVLNFVKILVHNGYGIKSADGKHFEKSPEILNRFLNSAAYSPFIMDLFTDIPGKLVPFVNNLIPDSLIERAEKMRQVRDQVVQEPNPYEVGLNGGTEVIPSGPVVFADPTLKSDEQAEFEAWKAAKAAEEQGMPRPPHESGQGFQK